jgi:CRISPR/Cas system-associated exonuclease Cas4 (RecB family)
MSQLATMQTAQIVTEHLQKAEAVARELTDRLEKFEQTNQKTELELQKVAHERDALAKRVAALEKVARAVIATQPEVIVEGLRGWLESDPDALVKAMRDFIGKAVQ